MFFFFSSSFHLLLFTVFNEGKIVLSKSCFSLSIWTIRMFCFVFAGAFFLQEMGKQFEKLFLEPDYGSGKRMENILLIISNIYNFKVSCFIFSWKWNDVKFTFVQCILCITLVWKNWNEWWKQLPWFNSTFLCLSDGPLKNNIWHHEQVYHRIWGKRHWAAAPDAEK